MTHETGTRTSPDGTTLLTRSWTPDRPLRALVVLVHGVHEHSGRYAYLASALMARGIGVRALDLRGHGQSDGPRGQVESFSDYLTDVAPLLAEVLAQADVPVFLMGHSMGGLVVASTVVEHGTDGLAGVILSSPALKVDSPALLRAVAPFVARWLPTLPVTKLDLGQLSRDPTVGRNYKADPLTIKRGVTARLGLEILTATEHVRQHPDAFDVPLYLFHGTADTLTDPDGTRWLAAHAASDDVTLAIHDGFYHETMNEPERDDVIGALADWLDARLGDAVGTPGS